MTKLLGLLMIIPILIFNFILGLVSITVFVCSAVLAIIISVPAVVIIGTTNLFLKDKPEEEELEEIDLWEEKRQAKEFRDTSK